MFEPTILKRENLEKIIQEVQLSDEQMMPLMASGVLAKNSTDQTNISYDIGVPKRDIGAFQGHGNPAGSRKLEVYGKCSFEFPHTFESKVIPGAISLNLRNPGSNNLQRIGVDQVTREQLDNGRHLNRQDEYLIAGALQGSVAIKVRNGAQLRSYTIDYQFPADHLLSNGGQDLGGTVLQKKWDDPTAPILDDLDGFIQKVMDESGYSITRAYTSPEVLTKMINSNLLRNYFRGTDAGQRFVETGTISDPIKGIKWFPHRHVYVPEGGSATRFIPKNRIIFTPEPDANWGEWFDAGAVASGPNGPERVSGRYSWAKYQHNPPSDELYYGRSGGAVIYVPKALIIADVF